MPITVAVAAIRVVTLWFRLWPNVSTSLVMRDSVSPIGWDSKCASGMRLILAAMSLRSLKHRRWVIVVMIHPWTNCSTEATTYRTITVAKMPPMMPKSMSPVPAIFVTRPRDSSVVASPSTFGPTTLNTVEPIARMITTSTANL